MNFSFSVFIFILNEEGSGAGGVVWKRIARRSNVVIRGNSGSLCVFYTARTDPLYAHKQQGISEHSADKILPLKDAYTSVKSTDGYERRKILKYEIC